MVTTEMERSEASYIEKYRRENVQLCEENKQLKSIKESYNEFLNEKPSQGDSSVCLEDKLGSYQLRYEYVQQRITLIKEELNELHSYLFKEKARIKSISNELHARANKDEIMQEQHYRKWKHWKNIIHKQSEQYYLQKTYDEMELLADRQAKTKDVVIDKPFSELTINMCTYQRYTVFPRLVRAPLIQRAFE